ncbi:UDP-glucose 4-epimerase GalE [Fulvivirga lutimaris]|uniref:UDP-glucose 4-epimerase GalE n=1 Tax=Fulvivirga lutimaris TaxID=1819566 RepID=UPI0012BD35CB|nr:UDP-glucose 4-epimerase GalE [Fulvivirga lutimaris]MTI39313.1 UDP-glucose 4-epimerase GalE [Fulvivirga lutimaris]
MKGKILVTGGAGYIGSHTCVELINAGYEPIIIDNFSNSEKFVLDKIKQITGNEITTYNIDCCNLELLINSLLAEKIIGCIHFAAYKAVGESSKLPLKYYHNNIASTVAILSFLEKISCPNFVFSSSCTVYGQPDILPVTEKSPIKLAESPYGRTKQVCEDIIHDTVKANKTLKAFALRYFNPIGAHPSALIGELPLGTPNNLVPYITQTAIGKREQLTVFGNDYDTPDGTCIRDYIHVVDLAKAHVKAMEELLRTKEPIFDCINLGTGKGNSVLEVIETFERVNDIKLNYKIGPRREGDVEKVYADTSYALNKLNWKTELSLEAALQDAWKWESSLN